MSVLKKGSRGDEVKALQENLKQLGFGIQADGIFGDGTDQVVRKLQTAFGYDIDGMVGDGTARLIEAQIGYGWNVTAPDAQERALRAQGKTEEADQLKAARLAKGDAPAKGAPDKGAAKGVKK